MTGTEVAVSPHVLGHGAADNDGRARFRDVPPFQAANAYPLAFCLAIVFRIGGEMTRSDTGKSQMVV